MHIRNIPFDIVQGDIGAQDAEVIVNKVARFDEATIRGIVKEALSALQADGLGSIAFSDLGCGNADFPHAGIAKIMVQEILRYARLNPRPALKKILFCLENEDAFKVFDKTVRGYVRHIQEDMSWGPYSTVDIIIEVNKGVVLIERSNPPFGWALPGGFLDYGESLEETARREAKEETNLDLEELRQFHTYSEPGRDARFQTISTVFTAKGKGKPQAGDDAKNLKVVPSSKLLDYEYAFDHKDIIKDYLNR